MQRRQVIQQGTGVIVIRLVLLLRGGLNLPAPRQIVPKLAHQHRRHPLTVVTHIAGNVADVEFLPCREECLKKQVPVVFPAGTVPRAEETGCCHQIKIHGRHAAGVLPVVHAQQADHFKGNGPHGHQGTEIDHAHQKTL